MWWVELLNSIVALLESGAGGGGGAYESIATATGTGSSGTITFSSIPSTYQHLQLRILSRSTATNAGTSDLILQINGVTADSSYRDHMLYGTGSAVGAETQFFTTNMRIGFTPSANQSAGRFGGSIVDLHDYTSTVKNKTMRAFSGFDVNSTGGFIFLSSGMNLSTSAITSLDVKLNTGNFATGSVVSLYGIKGA
jgi:hypothetical protein